MTGCTGRGKSTFCNFLSKSDMFKSEAPGNEMGSDEFGEWGEVAADLTGTQFGMVRNVVGGVTLRIIDLPGYLATQNRTGNDREDLAKDGRMVLDELAKALGHVKDGIDAVFITLKSAERYSAEEELLMKFISVLRIWDHCILLFTHGDKVGKEDKGRYRKFRKLISFPDFPNRCPVLHQMLQHVDNRFVIVESVSAKGDQEYYHDKVSEICDEVKEVVKKAGTLKNHPLLELARNAFDSTQETLDLKEKLDQEKVSRSEIEEQLKQARRKGEDRERDCERLRTELEREKEEMSRKLQEEENKRIQFVKQRRDLRDALHQKQLPEGNAEHKAVVGVLTRWLDEPQEGPVEVTDLIAKLSVLADHGRQLQTETRDHESRRHSEDEDPVAITINSGTPRGGTDCSLNSDQGEKVAKPKRRRCSML